MNDRIEIMHGVNLDQLGRRDPAQYGSLTLPQLETQVSAWARERGLGARFYQTNHEGAYVEHLHRLEGMADGLILNPGAWTHYSWAIHDALEMVALPTVEVHMSAVMDREEFRRTSVVRDLCLASVSGKGVEGYREALDILAKALGA